MDNNDNDNDNDGSLGSDLALVTMGGGGVDDDMIAKQNKSLHRSAVDLTKEQDGARQLAKKYAAESREWEGRYQRVNKQLEDRERDLLEIKTDVEKCKQKILAEDPNFTPRNRNELNLKWKSIHGRTMNGNSVNELFELFNSKK